MFCGKIDEFICVEQKYLILKMENSRLVAIIRSFTKKEVREFRKWLKSPAHNQREDIVCMFEYLIAPNHLYNEKALEKKRLFAKVFSKSSYDDAQLRQVIHFLLKAIEEFLVYQELKEDKVRLQLALASVYRKRKLGKAFEKTMRKVNDQLEASPFRNEHYIRNEYLIQQEQYYFLSEQMQMRNKWLGLQEVSDALDATYFADKLRQSCLMLAHQAVHQAGYKIGLLDEVLRYVEENEAWKLPAIGIYYYGYKSTVDKSNPDYFTNLREQINNYIHLFPTSEVKDIYLMAINYCIGKMNAGEEFYIREAFELYKQGIDKKIIIEDGVMSRWTYRNVVSIALKLKEYKWTENFITECRIYLKEEYRDNFYNYSRARLFFDKRDYDKAREFLVNKDFNDILLNLSAKSLLLKIFYEEAEFDLLDALLESTRIYLQRKKVMGYHKSNFQNVIYYTKKLVRVNPYKKDELKKLQGEINEASPLAEGERSWLLDQIEIMS